MHSQFCKLHKHVSNLLEGMFNERILFFSSRTSHQDVLKSIAAEGKLSEETDAKLKKIVQEFTATFQG